VKTVPAGPEDPPHDILMSNAFCEAKLVLRGKGNHLVFLGANSRCSEGVDIKLKSGGFHRVHLSNEFAVEDGSVKILSKATDAADIKLDDVEIEGGRVIVKTAGGEDQVLILSTAVDDGVSVKLGDGNDRMTIGQIISFGGVKADGGAGNDVFEDGTIDPHDLDGEVRTKNFELVQ
jgi:hypothetical protein